MRSAAPRSASAVSARQREVLRLIALGSTNKEMAHVLGISERGAAAHVSRLLVRFGVPNRAGLIARTLSATVTSPLPAAIALELEDYRSSSFMVGLTVGPDNLLVYVNEVGRRMSGIGPESANSERFAERRSSPGTKSFRIAAERAFRSGRATTVEAQEARWLRDDGSWASGRRTCVLQPVRDVGGNVFGILWMCMPAGDWPAGSA